MSIFSRILDKLRGHAKAEPASAPTPEATPAMPAEVAPPAAPDSPAGQPAAAPAMARVDVEAILNDLARKSPQKLDWRHSIVDLMKLLDLDSGLAARKELATELNYGGDMGDSAAMNMWLHRQVMQKLAENGGQVPAELRD